MRVALCQTAPELLNVGTNLEQVIALIRSCREKGAELVVFPELALTGYFVGLDYHKVALRMDSSEIKKLVAATKGTAAVVGFIISHDHTPQRK
jgi:predicted amidohydrolase